MGRKVLKVCECLMVEVFSTLQQSGPTWTEGSIEQETIKTCI